MANSVDLDQTPHSMESDLGLHCSGLSVPIFKVITVALDKRDHLVFFFSYFLMKTYVVDTH